MNNTRRYVLVFIIGIAAFVVGYLLLYNYFNSTELTITTKNTESYVVKSSDTVIHSSTNNNDTIRVPKSSTISIEYQGVSGYEKNIKEITIGQTSKSVSIDPFYSKERLATLADTERSSIDKIVTDYHPDVRKLYTITNQTLYHFGEWASVILEWKGEYSQNSDNLKVILKKESGDWRVIGEPSILFFNKNNPDIPIDILRAVNNN